MPLCIVANKLSHITNVITFLQFALELWEEGSARGKTVKQLKSSCFFCLFVCFLIFISVLDLQSSVYAFFMHGEGKKVHSQLEAQCNQRRQSANYLRIDSAQNGSIYFYTFASKNNLFLNLSWVFFPPWLSSRRNELIIVSLIHHIFFFWER